MTLTIATAHLCVGELRAVFLVAPCTLRGKRLSHRDLRAMSRKGPRKWEKNRGVMCGFLKQIEAFPGSAKSEGSFAVLIPERF